MDTSSYREESDSEHGIKRFRLMMAGIASVGYNALLEVLELEFQRDGQVWRFYDVPESLWYQFRSASEADAFFSIHIAGKYAAKLM